MREQEYYSNSMSFEIYIFEFLLNGGVATLYFDLTNYDKETYLKNMDRVTEITKELLELDKLPCEN